MFWVCVNAAGLVLYLSLKYLLEALNFKNYTIQFSSNPYQDIVLFDFLHEKQFDVRVLQTFMFGVGVYLIKNFNDYAISMPNLSNSTMETYDYLVLAACITMLTLMSLFFLLRPKPKFLVQGWIVCFQLCWIFTVVISILYLLEQGDLWDKEVNREFVTNDKYY